MLARITIMQIVEKSYIDTVEKKKSFSQEDEFIGSNAILESIEIVQIISQIEDNLEKKGIKGFDLFECIYECETLSFKNLGLLIHEKINTK